MGFYLGCRRIQSGAATQADSGGRLMVKVPGFAKAFAGAGASSKWTSGYVCESGGVLQQPARFGVAELGAGDVRIQPLLVLELRPERKRNLSMLVALGAQRK